MNFDMDMVMEFHDYNKAGMNSSSLHLCPC